ncbi:MAG: SAM-dependent methyltransferase, partial [Lentisphaerae bacterium]|nr:SAM-dependent methyltransferase [Lentisphaerota bacterium]
MPGERIGGSFRDPSGFVFTRGTTLYRQVNACYGATFDAVAAAGLFNCLWEQGLLVRHEPADPALASDPSRASRVIQPQRVPFVSFPYEWSFGMYQAAALATLEIESLALSRGFTLKDASAYNIQFVDGRPIFIDTLSFERYQEGRPWAAYRQFCQH